MYIYYIYGRPNIILVIHIYIGATKQPPHGPSTTTREYVRHGAHAATLDRLPERQQQARLSSTPSYHVGGARDRSLPW